MVVVDLISTCYHGNNLTIWPYSVLSFQLIFIILITEVLILFFIIGDVQQSLKSNVLFLKFPDHTIHTFSLQFKIRHLSSGNVTDSELQ